MQVITSGPPCSFRPEKRLESSIPNPPHGPASYVCIYIYRQTYIYVCLRYNQYIYICISDRTFILGAVFLKVPNWDFKTTHPKALFRLSGKPSRPKAKWAPVTSCAGPCLKDAFVGSWDSGSILLSLDVLTQCYTFDIL